MFGTIYISCFIVSIIITILWIGGFYPFNTRYCSDLLEERRQNGLPLCPDGMIMDRELINKEISGDLNDPLSISECCIDPHPSYSSDGGEVIDNIIKLDRGESIYSSKHK